MTIFHRRADRPMNCRQVGRRLQRYLDGDVDDLTARRIMRHLEDCRRCGMEAATYTEIKASLARRGHEVPGDTLTRLRDFGEQLIHDEPSVQGPTNSHLSGRYDDLPDETAGG